MILQLMSAVVGSVTRRRNFISVDTLKKIREHDK